MNKKLLIGIIAGIAALAVIGAAIFIGVGLSGNNNPDAGSSSGDASVEDAINYLKAQYVDDGAETGADYQRFNLVRIAGVPFDVVWSTNVSEDLVKIVDNGDGNAIILVNKECAEATPYQLTATVTADGKSASHTWNYVLPKGESMASIVDAAYALAVGESMETESTLTGTIISIDTPYSSDYKNITVTIVVAGCEDKPIQCYRLKGDGAEGLRVDDVITVTGFLTNYNGKIEFTSGCTLAPMVTGTTTQQQGENDTTQQQGDSTTQQQGGNSTTQQQGGNNTTKPTGGNTTKPTGGNTTKPTGGSTDSVVTDATKILKDAFALAEDEQLSYTATLTGKVTSVTEIYNADFNNISVEITVNGKVILCYRMTGDGVDKIAKNDTITVTGNIKNYKGTVEFNFPTLDKRVSGGGSPVVAQTDPKKIVDAAFKLGENESLGYQATLTGTVISINEAYSADYGNISVLFEVEGKRILCYRMSGDGVEKVAIGDSITVTGDIKNYNGTVEFNFPTLDKRVAGKVTEKTMQVVTAPKAGKAYKFGMVQGNVSSSDVYYLIGGMNGYYMATGNSALSAIDVYLEETSGGYHLYTKSGSTKTYINMVKSADGQHVNGAYESKASTVYTFDKESQTLVAIIDDAPYWFGTRNDQRYTTVGPCKTEYEGFYCKFYEEK